MLYETLASRRGASRQIAYPAGNPAAPLPAAWVLRSQQAKHMMRNPSTSCALAAWIDAHYVTPNRVSIRAYVNYRTN